MEDRPSIWYRGLIAAGAAVALNVVLFFAYEALGVTLRVPAEMGSTELADMTLVPLLVFTAVPSVLAVVLAVVLNRSNAKARTVFSSVVVLVAFLSLFAVLMLDSPAIDRVWQGLMHLVPAACLVALVSPVLRTE
ncbi:MAG: DUF6069 family protein [Acidimicrobiia bacterium]